MEINTWCLLFVGRKRGRAAPASNAEVIMGMGRGPSPEGARAGPAALLEEMAAGFPQYSLMWGQGSLIALANVPPCGPPERIDHLGTAPVEEARACLRSSRAAYPIAEENTLGIDMSAIMGPHGETRYFSEPLVHLADHGPAFKNIYIPSSEFGVASIGITGQFLESAEFYHSKYTSDERSAARQLEYEGLLSKYGYVSGVPLNILDIGAGSGGNTFIPLARMFPGSDYVATDLSPNLLSILHYSAGSAGLDSNLICVCTDASKTPMHADTFDLVVGSSILHHLIEPQEVLKRVHAVLKPGGVALFFEPFEKGHAVVALAFKQILRISRSGHPLDSRVEKALEDMLLDWSVRVGRDKSAEFYNHIDDKWLFTENFLNEICSTIGFDPLLMMKRSGDARKFTHFVENVLNLHSSLPKSILPDWAWNIVDEIDNTISNDLSADLHIEDWFSLQKRRDSSR